MRAALTTAANENGHFGEYCEYGFLRDIPRTSLCVYLVEAINLHGYQITKRISEEQAEAETNTTKS